MTPRQNRVVRQTILWVNGKSQHNETDDECCPDFSCCMPDLFEKDQAKRQQYLASLLRRYKLPTKKRKEVSNR